MNWPHTVSELKEFFLVTLFCFLPAIWLMFKMNDIIYGVLH